MNIREKAQKEFNMQVERDAIDEVKILLVDIERQRRTILRSRKKRDIARSEEIIKRDQEEITRIEVETEGTLMRMSLNS